MYTHRPAHITWTTASALSVRLSVFRQVVIIDYIHTYNECYR